MGNGEKVFFPFAKLNGKRKGNGLAFFSLSFLQLQKQAIKSVNPLQINNLQRIETDLLKPCKSFYSNQRKETSSSAAQAHLGHALSLFWGRIPSAGATVAIWEKFPPVMGFR